MALFRAPPTKKFGTGRFDLTARSSAVLAFEFPGPSDYELSVLPRVWAGVISAYDTLELSRAQLSLHLLPVIPMLPIRWVWSGSLLLLAEIILESTRFGNYPDRVGRLWTVVRMLLTGWPTMTDLSASMSFTGGLQ